MIQKTLLPGLALSVIIFCVAFLIPFTAESQNIVNVNNLTGTANATIPICNVSVGDLSASVALSYNASGIKVEDYDNSYGLGWRLIADASITRQVKGFPDDVEYQSDPSYSIIKGWLRSGNSAPQTIQSLSFSNDNNPNTCNDEISDATTIANNFSYSYDTEPDNFYISAPGLSCSFVFDGTTNHAIKTIPYRDYKITYTTDSYGRIMTFTVINENGIKYYFDLASFIEHSVDVFNPGTTVLIDPSTLEAFKRDFLMYRNKSNYAGYPLGYPVKYNDRWMLTKIEDTKGNSISYNFGAYTIANPTINAKYSYKEIKILKPNGSGAFAEKMLYGITTSRSDWHLQSISISTLGPGNIVSFGALSTATVVQFGWGGNSASTDDSRLLTITLPLEKKTYELLYTPKFYASPTTWNGFGRYFLKGLKATASNSLCDNVNTQFDFTYYDVNQANNTCYCTPLVLGPSGSSYKLDTIINAQDYWGYYNGAVSNLNLNPKLHVYPDNPAVELYKIYQIPGYTGTDVFINFSADRTVSTTYAKSGSLKTITSPTGGITELEYENNEFFDYDANANVLGGGLRIKKITNRDGLGTAPDVTEYSYNDPSNTSITTGRAVSVPKFGLAFQNSNNYGGNITNKVLNSTYVTTYDLNNEPKDILYGKVTVKKAGIGKSVYEYNTSGTFGSTATVADWGETFNYVSRTDLSSPTPCVAIAPSFLYNNNGHLQYPFTSNPNFDFERGLPVKTTHYNESGQIVATEDYVYNRSHTNPTKIYGVKLDEIGNTMAAYGKYAINTVVDNFMVTKTSKLYNSNSSTPLTDVENYVYTSPGSSDPYRLLKEIRKQNAGDPATTVTRYKYSKEYNATSVTGNEMNEALYKFNTDFNKTEIIETTQSRTEPGQSEKFTGGSFNTFRKFTIGDVAGGGTTVVSYLPDESYQFVNQAGVTGFSPSTISGSAFVWDNANYTNPPTKIKLYNTRGVPEVISDNSRIPKTILSTTLVTSVKVAEFTNAESANVGFSNFDGVFTGNFSNGTGNSVVNGAGRYSDNCLNFQPNTTICRTLVKQTSAKNLIVSFWLKDATASGYIYICGQKFGGACGTFTCTNSTIAVPFTASSQWKYYQMIVPWTASLTTISYGLSTSTAVKIDDVLIHPDNSNVTTYSYTTNAIGTNLLTAKTGINGIGNSYEYDNAGRLWLVRDQFDNIIEMKKYKLTNRHTQQIPSITINYPVETALGSPTQFAAAPPFAWETGDCDAPSIVYNWDFGDGTTGSSTSILNNKGSTAINHTYSNTGTYQVSVTASSAGMTNIFAQTPPTNSTNPLPVKVVAAANPCYPGTPVICASGIIQYTSSNQCILATCGSLPSTCSNTYFTVSGVTGTGASLASVYSVQWEIAPEGSSTWTVYQPEPTGGGGLVTSRNFHTIHTETYQMRARVRFCSSGNTSTAYSNIILIKNGD